MADEDRPYDPDWYFGFVADALAELAAHPGRDRQVEVVRHLYRRFRRNLEDNDKRLLVDDRLDSFLAAVADLTQFLDLDLLQQRLQGVPENFRRYLLGVRGGADPARIEIKSLMVIDGELRVYGFITWPSADGQTITVHCTGSGQDRSWSLPDGGRRQSFRYFGLPLVEYQAFDLSLRLTDLPVGARLWWTLESEYGPVPLEFSSAAARLAPDFGCRYAEFDGIALWAHRSDLEIVEHSTRLLLRSELAAFAGLARSRIGVRAKVKEAGLRVLYHLTKPWFGRRLVLYYDKLYLGGDNGQHLFEFAAQQSGSAKHRYVIQLNAPGARGLLKRGFRLVDASSPLRKLYPLHAHLIAATSVNPLGQCGLSRFERRWFANLITAHVVCIQHGLTVQYIPQLQARHIDNIERYYCASPVEVTNLSRPEYGYRPEMLRPTGLARFDTLIPDTRPEVLLCPTWRRYVANDAPRMGQVRTRSEDFLDSEYFAVYSRLLTDQGLLAGLRSRGFRLTFLVHPTLASQTADFAAHVAADPQAAGLVTVASSTTAGYLPHLKRAAVAISDYSGVQFDLAYLGRPLLYYLPEELPPSYPIGDYDPIRDGFGPAVRTVAELREALWVVLDRGAEPEPKYRERVAAFFYHHDRNNCARIYTDLAEVYQLD
ncbi:MAG TPA: CDP-glycerol glycerophosphotransferase family protein [Propionicimonas sp.]|nr:CDP-glycerol glycerophosphotransferase family protein [Propionicimonas sp.]